MAKTNENLFTIDTGILPKDAFIVIVKTEWNQEIVEKLYQGCLKVLNQHGFNNIRTLTVPGAFEMPFIINQCWQNAKLEKPKAFIALGCVLRGGTPHFDYVCKGVTDGIVQLNLQLPVPVIFGILTVDNQQQAVERTGGIYGNKGEEAAITCLKMIGIQNAL